MDVQSLGYVIIDSTDPQKWADFGANVMGMMEAPNMPDDGNVYLKMDERPFRYLVRKADADRLAICGWELYDEEDFIDAKELLSTMGYDFDTLNDEEAQLRRVKEAIRLQDPSGNTLELYWGADLDYAQMVSPVGVDGFETGTNGDMGLGHVVLPCGKLKETHEFYRDVLLFGDVDYMHFKFTEDPNDPGQGLHFMHCENPRHHSLALYEDANNPVGCVHLMAEVNNLDQVGYALDRANDKEVPMVASLGKHTNDHMVSFYMATPAGFAMEYGTGGLKMDWDNYKPTVSLLPSFWGHKFNF